MNELLLKFVNKIIVTGGNGFIGRHLVRKLMSLNSYEIILISNTSNVGEKDPSIGSAHNEESIKFYSADIRDKNAISNIFLDVRADTCVHLAAKISVADSIKNPAETMETNVNGTSNVLEACHQSQIRNFVFASSAAVYGDTTTLPISEDNSLEPLSPYGTSKMLAEQQVVKFSKAKKIENSTILRIFNVYGSGQATESDVISIFVSRMSRGLPPLIYGNGLHTRDFISVEDVVLAMLLSIKRSKLKRSIPNHEMDLPLVLNIGTGTPTSMKELAEKIIKIFGVDIEPIYDVDKVDNKVILQSYADISRARDILKFVPEIMIDEGLKAMIEPILTRK